jgi:hypothetical protein
MWVEIDQRMLASFHEIEELVDGVRSFEELTNLFETRQTVSWQAWVLPHFCHSTGIRRSFWLPATGTTVGTAGRRARASGLS